MAAVADEKVVPEEAVTEEEISVAVDGEDEE